MGLYSQEGLKNKLEKLDAHHDTMFNVGHLSTLCTPDQKMAQKIKSCLHLMEALEKEMVPGMITYAAYKIGSLPCFIHIITIQEVEH